MRTDQLIAELATGDAPIARPRLRVACAIFVGWLIALAGLFVFLGPPLQEVQHTGIASFAVKLGYTFALASLSAMAAIAANARRWPAWLPSTTTAAPSAGRGRFEAGVQRCARSSTWPR